MCSYISVYAASRPKLSICILYLHLNACRNSPLNSISAENKIKYNYISNVLFFYRLQRDSGKRYNFRDQSEPRRWDGQIVSEGSLVQYRVPNPTVAARAEPYSWSAAARHPEEVKRHHILAAELTQIQQGRK